MLSFFQRDVLDEIWDLIESGSEGYILFDKVWQAALWVTLLKYNISANLVRTIEQLYDKATTAVQMKGSIGKVVRKILRNCLNSSRISSKTVRGKKDSTK